MSEIIGPLRCHFVILGKDAEGNPAFKKPTLNCPMKHFIQKALYVLMFLVPFYAIAQHGCRLGGEKEFVDLLKKDLDQIQRIEGDFRRASDARNTTITNLPVQFHLVRSSTGQTSVANATFNQAITILNQYFVNAGLSFYQCSSIKYIDDNSFVNFFANQQNALMARSFVKNVINIYCVPSIEGGGVGGYTYLPGPFSPDLIAHLYYPYPRNGPLLWSFALPWL